ncbi:MAG TPA: hypothetical protein VGJ05_04080 [Fimbriiglobus sp.]|jgi:hypothetical protein
MARIRLDERECRKNKLPMVCMVCGDDADEYVRKKFAWEPGWVYLPIVLGGGILLVLILVLILRKSMTVYCPLCYQHRSHWVRRAIWCWGLLAAWLIGLVVLIAIGSGIKGNDHVGPFVVGGLLFTLVMFVVVGMISTRGVRPKEITDYDITLVGVHDDFEEAAEKELDAAEYARRRRRRRDRDDEEDEIEEDDRPRGSDPGYEVIDDDRPRRRRQYEEDENENDDDRPRRRRHRDEDD